jgi:hypothetical protein
VSLQGTVKKSIANKGFFERSGGGYVRLIDNYSRRVLRQSPYLPQVSSFSSSSIAWRERDVTVRLDADPDTISQDWPLRRQ